MGTRNRPEQLTLGVDIGGTKILAAMATPWGEVTASEYCATGAEEGPEAVIGRILATIERVIRLVGVRPSDLVGIGLACAGLVDSQAGLVVTSPHLPGWRNVPLKNIVAREFGVGTHLINDATAAALGEHRYGAGRGIDNLVYITVSTGIGGGIIIDGKPYSGSWGTAGEVGHMTIEVNGPKCACGNRGCLEALASGTAMAREAIRRVEEGARTCLVELAGGEPQNITAETISIAAQRGDPVAQEIISQAGMYLGVGLANLVNLFNPELIIIGGGVAQIGDMLLKPAQRVMRERAFDFPAERVRLVPAQLGDKAGVLGAVAFVLEERVSSPGS